MTILLVFILHFISLYVGWLVASMAAGGLDFVGSAKLTIIGLIIGIVLGIFGITSFLLILFIALCIAAFVMMPMWDVEDATSAFKILIIQGITSTMVNFLLSMLIAK